MGGKFHLSLNNSERPIANKYCEGKMKRTLKKESKGLESAKREAVVTSNRAVLCCCGVPPAVYVCELESGSVGGGGKGRLQR